MSDIYFWFIHFVTSFTFWLSSGLLVLFIALLLFLVWRDRQNELAQQRLEDLERYLLTHLVHTLKNPAQLIQLSEKDMFLLSAYAPQLLCLTKGETAQKLRQLLCDLGVKTWALTQLDLWRTSRILAAIRLLKYYDDTDIKLRLKQLLHHPRRPVRRAAADALAHMQDNAYLPAIIYYFQEYREVSISSMTEILENFGQNAAPLLTQVVGDKYLAQPIVLAALAALIKTQDTHNTLAAALPLCHHTSPDVRALAYQAVINTSMPLPHSILERAATDVDWRIRCSAAIGLARIQPLPTVQLNVLLRDEVWLVGLQAGTALYQAGAAGVTLLRQIARQQDLGAERARRVLIEKGALQT